MKLSIVSTLYCSEKNVEEFCQRATNTAFKLFGADFEILLVNDGSPDASLEIARETQKTNPHVKLIDLSRNFGHHNALMTGLRHALGEYVFLLDSDLEEQPEWLEIFYERMTKGIENEDDRSGSAFDVVFGKQRLRKGNLIESLGGETFYLLNKFISSVDIPKNQTTARLMSRRFITSLLECSETDFTLFGLMHLIGYNQESVVVEKQNRSESTYNFSKRFDVALRAILSFSIFPLQMISLMGIIIAAISAAFAFYFFVSSFFITVALGWTSLIVSIWFIGGLLMFSLGILGLYLSVIFKEVKKRPNSIVKSILLPPNADCDLTADTRNY